MLTFEINLEALDAQLDQIATKAQKAARLGAKAGAAVYYDVVKANAPVSSKGHWFQGTTAKSAKTPEAKRDASYWFESGSLKSAVYQVFNKASPKNHPEYQIAWNHRKVPYGFMVHAGTKTGTKPNPFVAEARDTAGVLAQAAMIAKFNEVMG